MLNEGADLAEVLRHLGDVQVRGPGLGSRSQRCKPGRDCQTKEIFNQHSHSDSDTLTYIAGLDSVETRLVSL
jgi:hypothetical protein